MELVPDIVDPIKSIIVGEMDVFHMTGHPSSSPSSLPTSSPTDRPTLWPSRYPSRAPSLQPSFTPTFHPSFVPSSSPSSEPHYSPSTSPSKSPSNPSSVPSSKPTRFPGLVPTIMTPTSIQHPSKLTSFDPPARIYEIPSSEPNKRTVGGFISGKKPMNQDIVHFFNYDPTDLDHGPGSPMNRTYVFSENTVENEGFKSDVIDLMKNKVHSRTGNRTFSFLDYQNSAWSTVKDNLERRYWEEFKMNRTLVNRCQSTPNRLQSPIDLCETYVNSECKEHHQIRNRVSFLNLKSDINVKLDASLKNKLRMLTQGGDYNLNDTEITVQILPSKLRILYSRSNPTLDTANGKRRSPHADFAHNWNGYIPAVHIDIKIPSEHTLCGRKFSGEYQIYFYHPIRRQPIVQSVFIDIHPAGRPHKHFQKVLNEWQAIFDLNSLECEKKRRDEQIQFHNFARRMENFVGGFVDDHEFTLRGTTSTDDLENQSSIEDYQLNGYLSVNKVLDRARHRVASPMFQEHYESPKARTGNDAFIHERRTLKEISSLPGTRNATGACVSALEYVVIGNRSHSCKSLDYQTFVAGCTNITSTFCPLSCEACYAIFQSDSLSLEEETVGTGSTSQPLNGNSSIQNHTIAPRWDPFKPRILNSIYLYGYGGSLTEPPCSEWVAWRVLDTPMQISYEQWNQMRNILFNHIDKNCKRTSVDWNGSVARPTQSLNQRPLWKCTDSDYLSDADKNKN